MIAVFCYVYWQVSSADGGHVIGKVYKQWSGFVRETMTDADNFGVNCECATSFIHRMKYLSRYLVDKLFTGAVLFGQLPHPKKLPPSNLGLSPPKYVRRSPSVEV